MEEKLTTISHGTEISGDITTEDDVVIDGSIFGTISGKNVTFTESSVNQGNIIASDKCVVKEGAVVIGDITAHAVAVSGAVKGNLNVSGPVLLTKTAMIQGNITSDGIQMDPGALIDGRCSRYAKEEDERLTAFKDYIAKQAESICYDPALSVPSQSDETYSLGLASETILENVGVAEDAPKKEKKARKPKEEVQDEIKEEISAAKPLAEEPAPVQDTLKESVQEIAEEAENYIQAEEESDNRAALDDALASAMEMDLSSVNASSYQEEDEIPIEDDYSLEEDYEEDEDDDE